MNQVFAGASRYLARAIDFLIALMFITLIFSTVTQIFMRSVLNSSPPWTEELARYAFMYVNVIGAAVCVRKKSHARVTAVLELLGSRASHLLNIFADLVILFVSYGFQCVLQVMAQRSPAMRICMSYVYFCIPLSGVCIALEGLISLCRNLGIWKEKEENPQ
mgnify:CR=1 FL=1